MTREQFEAAELHHAIEPHRVLCQDEMTEGVDAETLQSQLWGMFPFGMRGAISLPQMDRVRWIMFPEVRVQTSGDLFDDNNADAPLPDIMRVMDLQQEQLAQHVRARRQAPILIKLPTPREEAVAIADQLNQAHKEGHAWGDMAILCPDYSTRDLCAQVLHQRQMPLEMRRSPGDFDPTSNTI